MICAVGHGSFFYSRCNTYSDIDICLVLDRRYINDLLTIRSCTTSDALPLRTEVTLHYMEDISTYGWSKFQEDNHGVFYLWHLSSAIPLYGKNIFIEQRGRISGKKYRESLIVQVREYINRIQFHIMQGTLAGGFSQKYFTRIMIDMLLIDGAIDHYAASDYKSYRYFNEQVVAESPIFSDGTKAVYRQLINCEDTARCEVLASQLLSCIVADFRAEIADHGKIVQKVLKPLARLSVPIKRVA